MGLLISWLHSLATSLATERDYLLVVFEKHNFSRLLKNAQM